MTTLMSSHGGPLSASVATRSRSRDAFASGSYPSLRGAEATKQSSAGRRPDFADELVRTAGLDCFASLAMTKKEAERRQALRTILRTRRCGTRSTERVRLSAFHRGSRQRDAGPKGSVPGQASWDVVATGVTRGFLSQSSDSTSRTGRNAGEHDARNRPGAECIGPRAGAALAPLPGVPSAESVLRMSE